MTVKSATDISWIHQLSGWLRGFWLPVLGLAPLLLVANYLHNTHWHEWQNSLAGICLQLAGLIVVAIGIGSTRREFALPSLFQRSREKVAAFPWPQCKAPGSAVELGPFRGLNVPAGNALISKAPVTIEERLDALQEEFCEFKTLMAARHDEMLTNSEQQSKALQSVEVRFDAEHQRLRERLKTISTGGLDLSVCGLLWLSVGSVLGTVPKLVEDAAIWASGAL